MAKCHTAWVIFKNASRYWEYQPAIEKELERPSIPRVLAEFAVKFSQSSSLGEFSLKINDYLCRKRSGTPRRKEDGIYCDEPLGAKDLMGTLTEIIRWLLHITLAVYSSVGLSSYVGNIFEAIESRSNLPLGVLLISSKELGLDPGVLWHGQKHHFGLQKIGLHRFKIYVAIHKQS